MYHNSICYQIWSNVKCYKQVLSIYYHYKYIFCVHHIQEGDDITVALCYLRGCVKMQKCRNYTIKHRDEYFVHHKL